MTGSHWMEKIALHEKNKQIKNFKLLALVLCHRVIELEIYKDQYDWKYYL